MKISEEGKDIIIFCDCCGTRVGIVRGDCIILRKKHHGESHTTVLSLQELLSLTKTADARKLVRAIS